MIIGYVERYYSNIETISSKENLPDLRNAAAWLAAKPAGNPAAAVVDVVVVWWWWSFKRPANDDDDGTVCSSLPAHAHAAAAAAAASYDAAAYAGCRPFIVAERNVDA